MARVIGFDRAFIKKFTCWVCGAIVEYSTTEIVYPRYADGSKQFDYDGEHIMGLECPNCGKFHKTNK